jgi:hypothetical protein
MQDAVELVGRLSNVQAVALLLRLNEDLYDALPYAEVEQFAQPDARESLALDGRALKETMDSEASVAAARMLLTVIARDPGLAPVVMQAWDAIRKDQPLMVETVVAVGLVLNLTLFMTTTEMEFKVGKLKVKKKAADAKLLKELLVPVTELIKKFRPSL